MFIARLVLFASVSFCSPTGEIPKLSQEEYLVKTFKGRLAMHDTLVRLKTLLDTRNCGISNQAGWNMQFCSNEKPKYDELLDSNTKGVKSWCKEAVKFKVPLVEDLDQHQWCQEDVHWEKMGMLNRTMHRLNAAASGVSNAASRVASGIKELATFGATVVRDFFSGVYNSMTSMFGRKQQDLFANLRKERDAIKELQAAEEDAKKDYSEICTGNNPVDECVELKAKINDYAIQIPKDKKQWCASITESKLKSGFNEPELATWCGR